MLLSCRVSAVTDLWFVSSASLTSIAEAIGLVAVGPDAENYWEWVIGRHPEHGVKVDITRTHTMPAGETDTRIFLWEDNRVMSDALVDAIASRLLAMGITPIHAGNWVYRRGNEFDLVIERTLE